MKKSFYDWCLETGNEYLIDLWDCELNQIDIRDVSCGTASKYYFKCPRGIHESELYTINNITGEKHQIVNCRKCHSFGQWCLDNNLEDLLDRWDYELNDIDPFYVAYSSKKKYYFKCPKRNPLHPSELKSPSNLVKNEGSRRCIACNSFAQWGIDNIGPDFLDKYWSTKNTIDPFTILSSSNTYKVWIKCQKVEYHDDYYMSVYNFKSGERCPYCTGIKVNYFDSFGYKFPQSIKMWSDKNDKSPYDYAPRSNKEVWFTCDTHGDFYMRVSDFSKIQCECPKCRKKRMISAIQSKVENYIENILGLQCFHENKCNIKPINPRTGCYLLFDNEVIDYKLIIEVNGQQHYKVN